MAPADVPVVSARRGFLVIDEIDPVLGEESGRGVDIIIGRRADVVDDEVVKVLVEELGLVFEATLLGGLVECGRWRVDGW